MMFNAFCWYLNVIGLSRVAGSLRRAAFRLLASRARRWEYTNSPVAGWCGGVDVPIFGTVAFLPHVEGPSSPSYVFEW